MKTGRRNYLNATILLAPKSMEVKYHWINISGINIVRFNVASVIDHSFIKEV